MKNLVINQRQIGANEPCYIIAEIGINHNGDIEIAKSLISAAKDAGCNAVKFQKRTVEIVYTKTELETPRESPFGKTNGDLKRGLEFGIEEYKKIDDFCKELEMTWFVSPWDEGSVDFMEELNTPAYKIASASLTDDGLLHHIKKTGKPVIMSVGMSTEEEISHAISVLGKDNLLLLHTVSQYPAKDENINLNAMKTLMEKYPEIPVGYSGHETGSVISAAAVALGACAVERHLTLDVNMWGSDHKASIEPSTMKEMVDSIRRIESSMGNGKIECIDVEIPVKNKLRRK